MDIEATKIPRLRANWTEWIGRDWTEQMPAWLLSFTLHIILLVIISLVTFALPLPFELTLTIREETVLEEIPEAFHFKNKFSPKIGADRMDGVDAAIMSAPELAEVEDISESLVDSLETGDLELNDLYSAATPLDTSKRIVNGVAVVGVTGASGAIDRITHEILLSMEDRDTLVVWLFDQSGSLARQRNEINDRLERIYDELGLIREDIAELNNNRQPLLTAVMEFGQGAHWLIKKPTADVQTIQNAVASIKLDDSGIEHVFSSLYKAATEFGRWRSRRNVMLIAVTDEVGDDYQTMLEKTVGMCRKHEMPVFVLGVPAAFGQSETMLKWVDPDPKYDQSVRWGRVNQGPESLRPERVRLPFTGMADEAIDSGYGPFALTRLCYQTGGIYFAIHPNRDTKRRVGRRETEAFSSHLSYFFDPQRMRSYRPDYISVEEYNRRAKANPARKALLRAATMTTKRMDNPALYFIKRDEAQFANALTEAQKAAAKLEPKLNSLCQILKQGEEGRKHDQTLRWQAAYDLAFGQILAVSVRTRAYNEMLAKAKRGLTPKNDNTNTRSSNAKLQKRGKGDNAVMNRTESEPKSNNNVIIYDSDNDRYDDKELIRILS